MALLFESMVEIIDTVVSEKLKPLSPHSSSPILMWLLWPCHLVMRIFLHIKVCAIHNLFCWTWLMQNHQKRSGSEAHKHLAITFSCISSVFQRRRWITQWWNSFTTSVFSQAEPMLTFLLTCYMLSILRRMIRRYEPKYTKSLHKPGHYCNWSFLSHFTHYSHCHFNRPLDSSIQTAL